MNEQETLTHFLQVTADPYHAVAEKKKESGKKVIGCFPMYLPEELIHASGMSPVVLWAGNEPITVAHAHVPTFYCSIVRPFIDDWLKGRLDFLDGMIFYDTCLQVRALPFIFDKNKRPTYMEVIYHHAFLPEVVRKPHKTYLMENLENLRKTLENFSGRKITDDLLRKSIQIYNKNRELLRRLYELRRKKAGLLKAKDIMSIVQASMLMPKEEHNQLLERLLTELEQMPAPGDGKVRLMAVGGLCRTVPYEILDLIERMGANIIDDDLYVGSKYFINDADPKADPIEALADRYFNRTPPCPTKGDWESNWGDYIIDRMRKNDADGAINFLVKYCAPHMAYYPDVKQKMTEADIPELMIEIEHEQVPMGQLETRLQAFLEVARG
ncbi:2-hydroxyacyl-CoA dehydratase subunit D [Thermodesulfobacteriota bacterium]